MRPQEIFTSTRAIRSTHLPSMPLYDAIRAEPRVDALLARMHLQARPVERNFRPHPTPGSAAALKSRPAADLR